MTRSGVHTWLEIKALVPSSLIECHCNARQHFAQEQGGNS